MIQKGRMGGDNLNSSFFAFDAETAALALIEQQGAYEHETKEYNLPLVRQGRA
jgi:hypothetical protein